MKKNYVLSLLLFAALGSQAQLVNNGGTITIQQGAYVVCTGNLSNTTGTITNDGRIEVQGNFVNGGTYNSTANEDSVILSGAGNAILNAGGASINFLTINKTNAADFVTLGATAVVNSKLDYLQGILSTDYASNPSFVLQAPRTAVFNFAAGKEILGTVKRTGWTNAAMTLFNSAQMQVTTTGGSAPTDLSVTMLPAGDPTQVQREVKRKFLFSKTGGSGFTSDVRFPYATAELNTNVETNLVPWKLVDTVWNAWTDVVSRDAANRWVAVAGIDAASLAQEWKLADPKYTFNVKANLRGAWNGTDMSANINGILPTSQPYNFPPINYTGGENVGSIPNANVVDWVLVELRKPASGDAQNALAGTIIGRKAGFLLRNGNVVDLDGVTPLGFNIQKQGYAYITLRHRNHLGVISNAQPSNAAGTFTNDFTSLSNAYKLSGSSSDPVVLLSGGTKYGLWAGDASRNGVVNITDVNVIKIAIAGSSSGYLPTDVNMSNSINITDVNVTKTTISASGGTSVPTGRVSSSATKSVRTSIPDPIVE